MFMMGFFCVSLCVMLALLVSMGGPALLTSVHVILHFLLIFWQVSVFLFVRIPFVLTSFVITGVGCYKSRKYICNSFLVLQAGYF